MRTQPEIRAEFVKEMRRFLPANTVWDTVAKGAYWQFSTAMIDEQITKALTAE